MFVDGERHINQRHQRGSKMGICNLIPGLSTLWFSNDDPATAQAGQMIRHVRPRQPQITCQLRGIARPIQQGQQNP